MAKKVLVVEDNGALRFALKVMLEFEPGVTHVEAVPSGEHALRVLPELQPDVVITDHGLPGLTGEEVAAKIRGACPEARIISFSGSGDPAPWADYAITKAGATALEDLKAAIGRVA